MAISLIPFDRLDFRIFGYPKMAPHLVRQFLGSNSDAVSQLLVREVILAEQVDALPGNRRAMASSKPLVSFRYNRLSERVIASVDPNAFYGYQWLTPDLHRTHGRSSVQEYRLWLKRPSSIFCNLFIYSTLWMYDLAVTQFSRAFSENPIDGGSQFDLRIHRPTV